MTKRVALPITLIAAVLGPTALTACDLAAFLPGGDAAGLPPIEALFLPKPSDARSSTGVQAVCEAGNETIVALEARVDELNASVQQDLALLRALYDASPETQATISIYTVEADGRTLEVQVVDGGDELAITGTVQGEDDALISGAYREDGTEGAISIEGADGSIASAWHTEDAGLQIARNEGDVSAAVNIEDSTVELAITDGTESLAAHWDRETGEGEMAESGGAAACWSAGESADDMCDADCAAP
ncbi:MAG: hypothetical protein HYS27_12485 [Deltaproteobacteria bacterium]|nr:hypothetical protein [Deltaproteobacteria bacterium]